MTTILEQLETLATIENARAWQESPEKYLFCDNLISGADIRPNAARVEVLEILLEKTLANGHPLGWAFAETETAPSNKWP